MKKFAAIFVALIIVGEVISAFGAANVLVPKKASSVAKRETETSVTGLGGSLLPTALGVVGNVMALNKQQKELAAECEPTAKEIAFVNNLVKEWAIAGAPNPFDMGTFGSVYPCEGTRYEEKMSDADSSLEVVNLCYDAYTEAEARGAVWVRYPKAAVARYCPEGGGGCAASKQKKTTNLYEIFNAIDFDEKDYTKAEATQANALLDKSAKWSGSKLAAKRLESFGTFVTSTIGGLGQKTNTASVMQSVSGALGSSGLSGLVGSFGGIAGQLLDK
ncbi:MAG: hypothetical protein IKZ64_01595 [Alphaproteobacteria bacterium]|nr:hypothetical protein [Alphaproteobacteria bacterium]